MSNLKEKNNSFAKKIIKKSLRFDANSTTCFMIYQPKAPKALNDFKKINDDK